MGAIEREAGSRRGRARVAGAAPPGGRPDPDSQPCARAGAGTTRSPRDWVERGQTVVIRELRRIGD